MSNLDKVVLITGITGFIATHTALAFLDAGYTVKGTARTAVKAEDWIARFPAHKARFHYAVIPDMVVAGAFDEAVKGCDIVAHVASPDNEADFLIPAINGTKNLLLATKHEPRIQRVIYTSSLAAIFDSALEAGKPVVETEWNSVTYDEAKVATEPLLVYRASKALAERAFWDYIQDEKPAWAGSTICPCGTFAPPVQPLTSLSALNLSTAFVWDIANSKYKTGIPILDWPCYVDARDVALAHVRAAERDAAKGQRYLLIGGTYVPGHFVEVMHRHFPDLRDNLPPIDLSKAGYRNFEYDATKAIRELGIEYTTLEKMVVDTIAYIVDLQKQLSA
ncbi:NAD-P-binding protein [Mycena belliarum]|uniref:NAD-P-binding protein n=1 Tax=Mycena belliarum TaxID=1033014 RepID=A0AAD6XKR0_9AGAR|nr:NAD-P-binding protein [Mycena belliae]